MVYLIDNPPDTRQFRSPRREQPSGVCVVHTAEWFPDETPPDDSAEDVAAFIARRSNYGSYHDIVDSDSVIQLVRYDDEAFHDATGSNRHSYGVSAATQAHKWEELSDRWVDDTLRNMGRAAARYAEWVYTEYGIVIPARRVSYQESEDRKPGFISHSLRETGYGRPGRRTDPGGDFPWDGFLGYFEDEMERKAEGMSTQDVFDAVRTMANRDGKQGRHYGDDFKLLVAQGLSMFYADAANRTGRMGRHGMDHMRTIVSDPISRKLNVIADAVSTVEGVDAEALAAELNRIDAETVAEAVADEQAERMTE